MSRAGGPWAALGSAVPLSPSPLLGSRGWLGAGVFWLCVGVSSGLPAAAVRVGGWQGGLPQQG